MKYIIDANNLAGKLDILGEKDFDKILIEKVKIINQGRKRKYFLVFDSLDPMGDKYFDDGVAVIYTPRDGFYDGADDKIVELLTVKDEYVLVTDDLDLIKRVEKLEIEKDFKILKIKASDFAKKINFQQEETDEKFLLNQDDIDSINKELLKFWK